MDHADKACQLFADGRNCAQSVFTAFCDVTGLDEDFALRLSSSFGGGMGRMREVCGTCSAMFMIAGILYGYTSNNDDTAKGEHYRRIQYLAGEFRKKHDTIMSVTSTPEPEKRTAKYYKVRPCIRFVCTAAEILDKYIAENPPTNKIENHFQKGIDNE